MFLFLNQLNSITSSPRSAFSDPELFLLFKPMGPLVSASFLKIPVGSGKGEQQI